MILNTKPIKASVLLVELPPWDLGFPPLGIAYLSSYMEAKGIDVKVFDLNLEIYKSTSPETKKAWKDNDYFYWQSDKSSGDFENIMSAMIDKMLKFDTTVIGFSMTVSSRNLFKAIVARLKSRCPEKIIIVGGTFTAWEEFRNSLEETKKLVDYFVIGEGELPLCTIMQHVANGGKNHDISLGEGFSIWKDKPHDHGICIQGPRILKLDDIPYPVYNGFDIGSYLDERIISILGSRGCVRACNFCNDTVMWGKPFRYRSPENVVEEMKYCVNKYNKIIFKFGDLMLNGSRTFVGRLSELLMRENLKGFWRNSYHSVEWHGQIAVRKDIDLSLFEKMRKSGFAVANVGIESLSDNVLKLMNKGYSADDAIEFVRRLKEAGIEVQINLIVGFPGETEKDFEDTLEGLYRSSPYVDYVSSVSTCGVPPGSEIYRNPDRFGIDTSDNFFWYSKDGQNDVYTRLKRLRRTLDFLKKNNMRVLNVSEADSMESYIKEREAKFLKQA